LLLFPSGLAQVSSLDLQLLKSIGLGNVDKDIGIAICLYIFKAEGGLQVCVTIGCVDGVWDADIASLGVTQGVTSADEGAIVEGLLVDHAFSLTFLTGVDGDGQRALKVVLGAVFSVTFGAGQGTSSHVLDHVRELIGANALAGDAVEIHR
jgi:hypothetical protein